MKSNKLHLTGEKLLRSDTYCNLYIHNITIIIMPSSDDEQSVSSDDDQPIAKRQKTYDADGPIEDEKTAREKLREVGYDPDDAHTANSEDIAGRAKWENVTPMAYFASIGDLPMCRYLYHIREAATTAAAAEHMTVPADEVPFSPLFAAIYYSHPETAKWLFCHGAKEDAFAYADSNDPKPLSLCFRKIRRDRWSDDTGDIRKKEMVELAQWFVLNGALDAMPGQLDLSQALACCAATVHASVRAMWIDDDNPIVSVTHAKNALDEAMPILLSLSEDLLMQTDAFHTFLLGAIPTPEYSIDELKQLLTKKLGSEEAASFLVEEIEANGKGRALWKKLQSDIGRPESSNSCLAAHPGILERIGAYVGIVKNKTKLSRLRTFHDIVSELTISNLPQHCFEYD